MRVVSRNPLPTNRAFSEPVLPPARRPASVAGDWSVPEFRRAARASVVELRPRHRSRNQSDGEDLSVPSVGGDHADSSIEQCLYRCSVSLFTQIRQWDENPEKRPPGGRPGLEVPNKNLPFDAPGIGNQCPRLAMDRDLPDAPRQSAPPVYRRRSGLP